MDADDESDDSALLGKSTLAKLAKTPELVESGDEAVAAEGEAAPLAEAVAAKGGKRAKKTDDEAVAAE
jgi:hypothetical protein